MKTNFMIFLLVLIITFTAKTFAQTDWSRDANNPVLEPGSDGEWDDFHLIPSGMLFDGSSYHIWYGGNDGSIPAIGYASSPDGVSWTKYEGNPVIEGGPVISWDDDGVGFPCVIFDGKTYHMWFTGYHENRWRIGYATSTDRITWVKYEGNPVMDLGSIGSFDEKGVGGPCVMIDDTLFRMWYDGLSASDTFSIGYATSSDGKNWTRDTGNPIFKPSSGSWDSQRIEDPEIVFHDNLYHMWYTGAPNFSTWQWRIGYATSSDGFTWTKHPSNPVLTPETDQWDSQWVGYCNVFWNPADSRFEMMYGGGNGANNAKFGFATAPVTGIYDEIPSELPGNFELHQNFPNPFNPSTAISWQLAVGSQVDLSVYNILGQKVATLVNNHQPAGHHRVEWDATGFASGVYYYRIEAENFVQTCKMIYLK